MATRDVITRFRFDLDRAQIARLDNSMNEILTDIRGLSNEEVRLARSMKAVTAELRGTNTGFARAERNVDQFRNAVRSSVSEVDRLRSAQERFEETSRSVALAGDVQSNLGALRGLAGAAGLGGVGEGLGVAGEFVVLAEELPRLKTAVAGLPDTIRAAASAIGTRGLVVGGTLLGGFAAAALAGKLVGDELARGAEQMRSAAEVARSYYEAIVTGTTESIEAQIRQLEVQQEINRLTIENVLRPVALREVERRYADFFSAIGASAQDVLGAVTGTGSLAKEAVDDLSEATNEYEQNRDRIDILRKALQSNTVAANDAAEAETQLAQEREQATAAYRRQLDQLILAEEQARRQGNELSQEQIDERIASVQAELQANEELIRSRRLSAEATNNLVDTNQRLQAQLRGLQDATPDAGEGGINAFFDGLRERAAALAEVAQDVAAESTRFNTALADIATGLRERIGELSRTRARDLADAEREAGRDRSDAVRDAGEQINKLQRDYERQRLQIIRRANASIANAIQERDAISLLAARASRDEQLQEQEDNFDAQRQEINDQLRRTNEDISRRLQEQRATINRRYQEQVRDAQTAANRQRQIERQKHAQITSQLQAAARQAMMIESNKNRSLIQGAITSAQRIVGVFSGIGQRVAASASRSRSTGGYRPAPVMSPVPLGPAPRPSSAPSLASGFTSAGLAASQGISVNIANAGVTPRMVGQRVERDLTQFVRGFENELTR